MDNEGMTRSKGKQAQHYLLDRTIQDNPTHKSRREDNPVNNPLAMEVILLEYKSLNVEGEDKVRKCSAMNQRKSVDM